MSTSTSPRGDVSPLKPAPTPTVTPSRFWVVNFYRSALGKKYVMAVTGLIGLSFVVFHMIGNLHAYEGAEKFAEYGEGLREIGEPIAPRTFLLWIARLGLIGALVGHLHAAFSLTRMNRIKRPVKYQSARHYIVADYASRTMFYTGLIVLLFLFFHLADLTWGWFNPDFVRGEIHRNLNASLSRIPVGLFYIAANLALGLHIFHGTWSLFQSLGINNRRFNHWRRHLAIGLTVVVVAGNLTFPLAAMFGLFD